MQTFEEWMQAVDCRLTQLTGLTSDDLADSNYYDKFDDGIDPEDAAIETLEENDFPF